MKKLLVMIVMILLVASVCVPFTFAEEGDYYVVGNVETYFIQSNGFQASDLFVLPKGFAFKVTGNEINGHYPISYAGMNGYVTAAALSNCTRTTSPERTSPTFLIEATPSKAYSGFGEGTAVDIKEKQAVYLGTMKDGDDLYYAVNVDGGVYYVFNGNVNPTNKADLQAYLDPQKTELDSDPILTPSGNAKESESKVSNNVVLRIILTAGIIIPALIVVILLFKPRRNGGGKRRQLQDDEVRYEDFE